MDRRSFLQSVSNTLMVMTLDPDLALWVPGKKTIFIPQVSVKKPAYINRVRFSFNDLAAAMEVPTRFFPCREILWESHQKLNVGDYVKITDDGTCIGCNDTEAMGICLRSEPIL